MHASHRNGYGADVIVRLSSDVPAELVDIDRVDRLHAELPADTEESDAVLAPWCRLDDEGHHVWLDIDACRELGREALGDAWVEQYDGMIAYARSKGWTDETGASVRAHIETLAT